MVHSILAPLSFTKFKVVESLGYGWGGVGHGWGRVWENVGEETVEKDSFIYLRKSILLLLSNRMFTFTFDELKRDAILIIQIKKNKTT